MPIPPRRSRTAHGEFGAVSSSAGSEPSLFFEGVDEECLVIASAVVASEAVEKASVIGLRVEGVGDEVSC